MVDGPADWLALPLAHLQPEWRRHPITGDPVVIAPERGTRPIETSASVTNTPSFESCPFCAGQEHQTPPELFAIRVPNSPANGLGWRVRVVPNRYPAVRELSAGFGKHELIIEASHHETHLARLPSAQLAEVLLAWRERLRQLREDGRFLYAQLFKNHGAAAGASVAHCHSQLIALPHVPPRLQQELDAASVYFVEHQRCILCDLVRSETKAASRMVAATSRFVALAAYAGRQPYETWILPREHQSHYENISQEDLNDLGKLLGKVLRKMHHLIDDLAYNLILHTAPMRESQLPSYHWRLEILPRIAQLAGFECGTGLFINMVRPEDAAERLRHASEFPADGQSPSGPRQ